jgi:hypothetical protein
VRSQLNAAMLPSATLQRVAAAIAPALVLVAIAVWEIVAAARAGSGVPGATDWERASDTVRTTHQPGDLIVFAPAWIDPVGREHLGDLMTVDQAARMDADRYGVIWELSMRGARAPETRGLEPNIEIEVGGITVRRFEREPAHVVTDFLALPPPRPARLELAEVGFAPHRCVQVIPPPGGTVTLDYGDVELGATLVGSVGLADVFTRRDVRDPGRLELMIDGETAATATAGVDSGWVRFVADTTPGRHHVEVVATAVGPKSRDRRICFAAEARE